MSVYSNFFINESTAGYDGLLDDVDVDTLMYGDTVEEAYEEDSYEAAMRCVSENTTNYNAIMQACAINEFCYFEENGTEMVYTEGTLSDWKDSAIAFFKKVWDKIQSIFKKVLMQFASWSKNDKDFYNKYKKQLNTKANQGFGDVEVKWFKYRFYGNDNADAVKDLIDESEKKYSFTKLGNETDPVSKFLEEVQITPPSGTDADKAEKWVDAAKKLREDPDKITDVLDGYRGQLAGYSAGTKIDAKEFSKEVTEYFQGSQGEDHESSKDTVALGTALDDAMKFLVFSDKAKSELGKVLSANKRSVDQAIKAVNNISKGFAKDISKEHTDDTKIKGAKHTLAGMLVGAMKQEKNILTQYNGLALNALKACSRQSKAICVKAATYIDKDKDYKYQSESATSLLGSINLI